MLELFKYISIISAYVGMVLLAVVLSIFIYQQILKMLKKESYQGSTKYFLGKKTVGSIILFSIVFHSLFMMYYLHVKQIGSFPVHGTISIILFVVAGLMGLISFIIKKSEQSHFSLLKRLTIVNTFIITAGFLVLAVSLIQNSL